MYKANEVTNKKTWEDFLSRYKESNFLQSWMWGEFHEKLGHKVTRSGIYDGDRLVGVMLSIVERAKRGKYLTIPAGPIIDWKNYSITKFVRDEMIRIAKKNNCAFVRIRPQLESGDFSKNLFKRLGFKPAPMHLHAELTNQLDITKPDEVLITNMRKGTRYEIRKAQKLGIRVEESTQTKSIRKFYNLQVETAKRQGFVPFSYEFLAEQFDVFAKDGNAVLYSAYLEKKLLAQAFIIFYGNEAVYHYGASTEEGRQYPGAYLIQWLAILEAKKRGIERYNFWGVAREDGHRFANLSMFKRGFGGEDIEYLHAQDYVINKPKYFLNLLIEKARKKIRHV